MQTWILTGLSVQGFGVWYIVDKSTFNLYGSTQSYSIWTANLLWAGDVIIRRFGEFSFEGSGSRVVGLRLGLNWLMLKTVHGS